MKKKTYQEVKDYIELFNYELLSTEYINNSTNLDIKCDKGHVYKAPFGRFQQGKRCPHCNGGVDKFISTVISDTVKNEYCKKNNIKLIRIPYHKINNIEKIIVDELKLK